MKFGQKFRVVVVYGYTIQFYPNVDKDGLRSNLRFGGPVVAKLAFNLHK